MLGPELYALDRGKDTGERRCQGHSWRHWNWGEIRQGVNARAIAGGTQFGGVSVGLPVANPRSRYNKVISKQVLQQVNKQ
jgi:hypothetical protein